VPPVTSRCLLQVHTACKDSLVTKCPLGLCKVSVIPPTALNSIDSDGGYCALLSQPFPRIAFSGPSPPSSGTGYVGDVEMWWDPAAVGGGAGEQGPDGRLLGTLDSRSRFLTQTWRVHWLLSRH